MAGLLIGAGIILAAAVFAHDLLPDLLAGRRIGWLVPGILFGVAGGLVIVGILMLLAVIRRIHAELNNDAALCTEPDRSMRLYGEVLVGLGAALLIGAIASATVLSGIVRAGHRLQPPPDAVAAPPALSILGTDAPPEMWDQVGRLFGRDPYESMLLCSLLLLSVLLAILGALFFFSTAMWEKMAQLQKERTVSPNSDVEQFSERMFWAGLWFRLGEAVTFSLVLFLIVRQFIGISLLWLPLLALLIGMFLKAGERLITGIAMRLFAAFEQLVPMRMQRDESPTLLVYQADELIAADSEVPTEKGAEVVRTLQEIAGVERVRVDGGDRSLRILYMASKTGPSRIERELNFYGLTLKRRT
ncbi:MAG: hypothetical protein ACOC0P_02325 [Planctomycetota bacterium]